MKDAIRIGYKSKRLIAEVIPASVTGPDVHYNVRFHDQTSPSFRIGALDCTLRQLDNHSYHFTLWNELIKLTKEINNDYHIPLKKYLQI